MFKQLKYDFYQVVMPQDTNIDFGAILNQIFALGARERLDNTGDYPIRLQDLTLGNAYLIGDIARIRMNDIPDKMKLTGETEPLDLDEDEGLGEIATFLYHPTTNILMMMRNRNAVGVAGLGHYISNIARIEGIQFNNILQVEAYQRLQRLDMIQRFDLEVAAPGNGTFFRDMGLSPEAVLDLIGVSPKVRLSLAFSTGYDRELSLPKNLIERIATSFRNRRNQVEGESLSLVVSGREHEQKEVIDLFEDVLTDYIDVNIRNQRRITDDQRHAATTNVWIRHRDRLIGLFAPPRVE